MSGRQKTWLVIIVVLLAVLTMIVLVGQPWYWRAAPASPHAGLPVQPRSPSVLYEVFKPAIDPLNALIDYFRPSHLRQIACALWPERLLMQPSDCE